MNDAIQIQGYDTSVSDIRRELHLDVKAVPLERPVGVALDAPSQIENLDSVILIRSIDAVCVYDTKGKFLRTIGGRGHGKGEYISLPAFYLNMNNDVILVDAYKNVLLKYNLDGQFLEETKLQKVSLKYAQHICALSRDCLFIYNYIYDKNDILCTIVDTERDEEDISEITTLRTGNILEPVGNSPCFAFDGKIRYVRPFEPYIYNVDGSAAYAIETLMPKYTGKEIGCISNFGFGTYAKCKADGVFPGFTDIFETERYIMLNCKNMRSVLIDKESNTCKVFDNNASPDMNLSCLFRTRGAKGGQFLSIVPTEEVNDEFRSQSDDCDFYLVTYEIHD